MKSQNQISTVTIIGSGNVATNISIAFAEAGISINEVYSPTKENSKKLADILHCNYISDINKLNPDSDLYLLAIPDTEIQNIAKKLSINKGIMAHTSGSQPITILKGNTSRYGIFYPPQTMTREKHMSFEDIPICIEASDQQTLEALTILGNKISNRVVHLDSEQRLYLHLTAVTVNNFTNLLYDYAHNILSEKNIDFGLLLPLIHETALKVHEVKPEDAQTGPARRNDLETINRHIELLENYPDFKDIYSILSKKLIRKYHEKL